MLNTKKKKKSQIHIHIYIFLAMETGIFQFLVIIFSRFSSLVLGFGLLFIQKDHKLPLLRSTLQS